MMGVFNKPFTPNAAENQRIVKKEVMMPTEKAI